LTAAPKSTKPDRQGPGIAAGRSALYSFFAKALAYPTMDLYQSMADGELVKIHRELASQASLDLPGLELVSEGLPSWEDFQAEYIALFDLGTKGPPCPLYEGAVRHDRGRKSVMEDLLRFYGHFDVKMSERIRELPDQLSAELEFMHYLAFLEAEVIASSGEADPGDPQRAERDFLDRHLLGWVPELARMAADKGAPPVYCSLLDALVQYIGADREYLGQTLNVHDE